MPGLVVFRRRWSVGSDDLVVPGVFLFVLHLIWIVVLCAVLGAVHFDHTVQCVHLLWEHVLGYLAIMICSLLVELFISVIAMRGSILDTEQRASIKYLIYIRLGVMLVETVWLALGIMWLSMHYINCPVEGAKEAVMGIVICNCCVILSVGITVWCTFDAAGRSWVKMKKYQRSMRESESRFQYKRSGTTNRNWRQRKVIRAYQDSWDHRCRLLFCCMRNSDRNRNSFADIARLLSDFFRDLDVVPSDVVAGLVLLRKFQKIEREAIVKQHRNDTYEYLSGVPVTSQTQFLALNDPQHLEHFQAVIHYMHFALAAYGWPMFLMTNSKTGVCQLCARLRCCCFPCRSQKDPAVIIKDNCCHCNYAALRKMVEVGEVEVIYATYHVDVGETPFFVAVDYSKKKVVLSIRGTLSMKDVITDLNAEGETIPLTPPREDWLGHKGMVQAAEYIRVKLEEEEILSRAFNHNPQRGTDEFELVLVGHSLGAGTASILAILLRQHYPSLQCFAYSPPGGSISMPAVEYTKSFITSVVVGKDVVPRIGLHQLESLRADLINTIKRSKDPKWKTIMCSVVCCGCAPIPTSAVELKEDGTSIMEYQKEKGAARDIPIHPSDSSIALTVHQPLYPPGRIIHVVRHHPTKGEQKYEKRWRQVLKKHEPVYQAVWANNTDFDEVLISPVMIQDHMPDNVLQALNKVITTIGPAKPQRSTSNNNSAVTSLEHLDSERCHLLASNNPMPGSPKAATPPHKLCLETSFTSLQSPTTDAQCSVSPHSSTCSHLIVSGNRNLKTAYASSPFALHPVLSWEYAAILEEHHANNGIVLGRSKTDNDQKTLKIDLIHDDWFGLAPLATPESLSELSSISSRASSLVLNIDKSEKELGCVPSRHLTRNICIEHNKTNKSPIVLYKNSLPSEIHKKKSKTNFALKQDECIYNNTTKLSDDINTIISNSSEEDVSFESAQENDEDVPQFTQSNSSLNNGKSSEVFSSVKGTPFTSVHQLLINRKDVISWGMLNKTTFTRPSSVSNILDDMWHSDLTVSSSPKKAKFFTPQNSFNSNECSSTEKFSTPENYPRYQSTSSQGKFTHPNVTDYNSTLYEDSNIKSCLHSSPYFESKNNLNQEKKDKEFSKLDLTNFPFDNTKEIYSKNKNLEISYISHGKYMRSDANNIVKNSSSDDSLLVLEDDNICNSFGNNNVRNSQGPASVHHRGELLLMNQKEHSNRIKDCHIKSKDKTEIANTHFHALESLPLLTNIGDVSESTSRVKKKYVYSITSVGRGESSV